MRWSDEIRKMAVVNGIKRNTDYKQWEKTKIQILK